MFYSPEFMRLLVEQRHRSIEQMRRPVPAAGDGAGPRVRSRALGPPGYYRGIAAAVWRAALSPRPRATVLPTAGATADRVLAPAPPCS